MKTPRPSPKSKSKTKPKPAAEAPKEWDLRLYVAGPSLKSASAFRNLEKLCKEHLPGRYHIEVVDLIKHPQLAQGDQILAVPTVIRKLPSPICKVVGDLSNTERVLIGLDLRPRAGDL